MLGVGWWTSLDVEKVSTSLLFLDSALLFLTLLCILLTKIEVKCVGQSVLIFNQQDYFMFLIVLV